MTSVKALTIWCNVRKKKAHGTIPKGADNVKKYAKNLEGEEVMTLREYLLDQGYHAALVDKILESPETALVQAEADDGDMMGDGGDVEDRDGGGELV